MQVISASKDCTPGSTQLFFFSLTDNISLDLYEWPGQQEAIVQSCREAATKMFSFQDIIRGKNKAIFKML